MAGESGKYWDADYRKRGVLYGGAPRGLPAFCPGAVILELGCGDGKTLLALCGGGRSVVAVDYAPGAAALARARAYAPPVPAVAVADARQLPFVGNTFDAVIVSHILGHNPDAGRGAIVREIRRLLRPGGLVWFRDFSDRDFRSGTGTPVGPGTRVRGTGIATHYFSEEEVRSLFSGFEPVFLRYEDWVLRVRGTPYPRSEIAAQFLKPCPLP